MPSSDDESEPPASASDSDDERPSPFIAIPSKLNHEDDDTVPYILSLPNEILSAILIHLSILDPTCLSSLEPIILDRIDRYPRLRPDDPRVSRLGWMNAAHVCRRLRSVALATPELWASIVIVEDSTRWLSEILRRSGSQALSLLFHPLLVSLEHAPWIGRRFLESPADTDDACAILCQLDVLSRVEYIKIKDLYEWLPVAQTLLAHPAPRLKKPSLTPHEPSTKSKMVVLPQMLFASSAPHLRSLSLTQCDFSWSSLACFSTLTKLKLTRPEMAPRAEYEVAYALPLDELETASLPTRRTNALDDTPMKEILASLRALPLLEELQLMHVLPIKQALNEQGLPRLELRHLHTLCIYNSRMGPIFHILDVLDASKLRHFELGSCTIARPSDAHLQQHYAPLSRFLSRVTTNLPLPITYLRLDLKVSQVCVRAHFVDLEDPHDHIPDDHGEFCLAISLTILGTPNSPENFPIRCTCIEPIVSAISLSNLDTLEISDKAVPAEDKSYYTVDFVFWRRIYDLCSNAREVVARSLALVPLLPLLACRNLPHWRFTKPPAGTEPTVPVFPRLEHLDMSVGNLDQTDRGTRVSLTKGHPRLKHTDPTTVYLEVVRECLASRMESELPKLDYVRVSLVLWPREAREGVNKFEEEFRGVVQEGSGSCRLDIYTLEDNRWTTERRHLWAPC